jgi:WD40 repeat protein
VWAAAAAVLLVLGVSLTALVIVNGQRWKEFVARQNETAARRDADRLVSRLTLLNALHQLEEGNTGRGLLNLAHGLSSVQPHDADLDHAFRISLAGWRQRTASLGGLLERPDAVQAVCYAPDGRLAAVGSAVVVNGELAGEVALWDSVASEPAGDALRQPRPVRALTFRANGAALAVGCDDGSIHLWDPQSRRRLTATLRHTAAIRALAFSPRGDILAACGEDGAVLLWETESRSAVFPGTDVGRPVQSLAFNPRQDAIELALGCKDGSVWIWDARGQSTRRSTRPHRGPVPAIAFGPNGAFLMSGGADGFVRMWDAAGRIPGDASGLALIGLQPIDARSSIESLAINPEGTLLACGTEENNAQLWDIATCEPYCLRLEHKGTVGSLAFRPDGQRLLTGSYDNFARTWIIPPPPIVQTIAAHEGPTKALAFGPNCSFVSSVGANGTIVRHDRSGRPIGEPLRDLGPLASAALSKDGKLVVLAARNGPVTIWNLEGRRQVVGPISVASEVRSLALRGDGKAVLIGSIDGETALWDLAGATPRLVRSLRIREPVHAVDFSSDGELALTAGRSQVQVWNLQTGSAWTERIDHPAPIYAARFSPNDKRIVTCGENNTAQLWDTRTGLPAGVPMIHKGSIVAAAFSPDSRVLATGSLDGVARFWDVETGAPIGPPLFHNAHGVTAVAFGPLNRLLTTADETGRVRFWEIPHTPTESPEDIWLQLKVQTGLELHRAPDRHSPVCLVRTLSGGDYRDALGQLQGRQNR